MPINCAVWPWDRCTALCLYTNLGFDGSIPCYGPASLMAAYHVMDQPHGLPLRRTSLFVGTQVQLQRKMFEEFERRERMRKVSTRLTPPRIRAPSPDGLFSACGFPASHHHQSSRTRAGFQHHEHMCPPCPNTYSRDPGVVALLSSSPAFSTTCVMQLLSCVMQPTYVPSLPALGF